MFYSVEIFGPNYISIGEDTFIGHSVLITGSFISKVEIGKFVDIAPKVTLNKGTHVIDMEGKHTAGCGKSTDIKICDGVWIGMGSIILPGVVIGEKSIVAAASVVVNSVPAYSLVTGNPAKLKKTYDKIMRTWMKV